MLFAGEIVMRNLDNAGYIKSAWLRMLANEGHEHPNEISLEFRDGYWTVAGTVSVDSIRNALDLLTEAA
jgi:ribulose bisphosphate carboxylase small subunit